MTPVNLPGTPVDPEHYLNSIYKPDVLQCLANLSNDEVFTPPEVVNAILDLLPKSLWSDSTIRFLDPVCKSGVFLREIAKRLIDGLESEIPDLQKRLDHIFHEQVFGIAITELTSLISRRTVYCSKNANSKYTVSPFENKDGNIFYSKRTKHKWEDGRCIYCGANQETYDRPDSLESYAYQFIHPGKVFEDMKFDVIVGNPPYQLGFGLAGGNSSNAKSIYNLFIQRAINLNPRYVCMITPSRWMTKTSQGIPESWVDEMIHSNHFKVIHDFENASDCFPQSIMGGVNYFLYNGDYTGKCNYYFHTSGDAQVIKRTDYLDAKGCGIVIRNPQVYPILEKIEAVEGNYSIEPEKNFANLVSPKHFYDNSELLTSNWKGYQSTRSKEYCVKYHVNINKERTVRWVSREQIPKHEETIPLYKVFIPAANGSMDLVLGKPFYGEPGSICSQTFLVIGFEPHNSFSSKKECENVISYIQTRFFRFLVSIKKVTQNGPRGVYQFVPLQDFSKPWTDKELYAKYGLTDEEIAFIESMIRPME